MNDIPANSPIRQQLKGVLVRARRLPPGRARNDLRQLAAGLRWLEKHPPDKTINLANARERENAELVSR